MYVSRLKLFLLLVAGFFLNSCGNPEDENIIDDPTTIYSIIKEDTSAGIDVVGSSRSNPMEVRKRIFESEIQEHTFEQKRKTLYSILDTLHKLKANNYTLREYEDADIYNEVDSLNYLAVHYLKNLLTDKKSKSQPIRHKMLNQVASSDKSFSVYYWEENIGVDIPTMINVYQYTGLDGALHSFFYLKEDELYGEDFIFSTSKIIGIHKLNSTNGKLLYLLNFEGCVTNKDCFKGSTVVEVTENELEIGYDAFEGCSQSFEEMMSQGKYTYTTLTISSVFFMEYYADGAKLTPSYNPKTKELTYKHTSETKSERKVFLFNGWGFGVRE
jgi:hypothetical protein